MKTNSLSSRLLATALLVTTAATLCGCGSGGNCGGGGFDGSILGGLLGRRSSTQGSGRGGAWNSPVLGGGSTRQPSTQPPDLTQTAMPAAPAQFDSNTEEVLKRYNAQIGGPWATPEYVEFVMKSMQLYPPLRQHPLQIIVGPDPDRPGLSGFWTTSGGRATIYLYDPSVASTPAHEIAHDQTLLVQRAEGQQLMSLYGNVDNSAYARNYSTSDEREFAADALSYWARRVAKLASNDNFQPPREVIQALQPMLVEALRTK